MFHWRQVLCKTDGGGNVENKFEYAGQHTADQWNQFILFNLIKEGNMDYVVPLLCQWNKEMHPGKWLLHFFTLNDIIT